MPRRSCANGACRSVPLHEADGRQQPLPTACDTAAGHDARHVREDRLQAADDEAVLARAREQQRTLVSADTDFGTLLARTGQTAPSVILLRRSDGRRPEQQAALLLANLAQVTDDLDSGAVVVITDTDLRVRQLPIPPGPLPRDPASSSRQGRRPVP